MQIPKTTMDIINQLTEGDSELKEFYIKNHQSIDFLKLQNYELPASEIKKIGFLKQAIEEVFSSNPDTLQLFKNLCVINTELETNIDRKCVESCFKSPNIEETFNELINVGIVKRKTSKKGIYELSPKFLNTLEIIKDEKCHEKALQYYKHKKKITGKELNDDVEVLYHRAKIKLDEKVMIDFLTISRQISPQMYGYKRLIDVGRLLLSVEDKYLGPIQVVLGNLYTDIGQGYIAVGAYLNSIEIYKKLAEQHLKIYLPYVLATQQHLGTLYVDLKRFEDAEKLYIDALKGYKKLKKQYFDVHSPTSNSTQKELENLMTNVHEFKDAEAFFREDLEAYKKLVNQYYDVYLPDVTPIANYFGYYFIDIRVLEDATNIPPDSVDRYKIMAKLNYDMYLADLATTRNNLGSTYNKLFKYEAAEKMYLKALKIRKKLVEQYPKQVLPSLVFTLNDLGDLYFNKKRYEEAEKMYLDALRITKNLTVQDQKRYQIELAVLQNKLGNLYLNLKNYPKAEPYYLETLKEFNKRAKKNPKLYLFDLAVVQNNLGLLFMYLNKYDKAESFYTKSMKSNPKNSDTPYNYACLESLRNNQVKALELLTIAIELDKICISWAKTDEKFDSIKDLEEFKELISEEGKVG